jgi:pentatricopeptide repeat protein
MVKWTAKEKDALERTVNDFIKSPKDFEEGISKDLIALGIEPSVDTVLSMYCGIVFGLFSHGHLDEAREFIDEMMPVLERKAWEIRQAIIKERLK